MTVRAHALELAAVVSIARCPSDLKLYRNMPLRNRPYTVNVIGCLFVCLLIVFNLL